jgi:hypothetical protein
MRPATFQNGALEQIMKLSREKRRGQILVMVTLALFAMCGMLGLAVDLGWSYFVKKSAQAAADAAAMAAVGAATGSGSPLKPFTCGTGNVACLPTPTTCLKPNPGSTNIDKGCLYAERNGFVVGGKNGRQNVLMQADVTSPPPTVPGVQVQYWVTARVSETIPQLFSAILGNTSGITSARATAGYADSAATGSLILLNRENDCIPLEGGNQTQCGVDLLVQANDNQGMYALRADGGILLASTKNGENGEYAGENQGGGTVYAPFTYIRGAGGYTNGGSASWIQTPSNGKPDTGFFKDPMRGYFQPPPAVGLVERPVPGGTITGSNDPASPTILTPGSYFASTTDKSGKMIASGEPIRISGSVYFTKGTSDFAEYVFFGGISASQQGQGSTVFQFDSGRYVFAGAKPKPNGTPTPVFDITSNLTMTDGTAAFVQNSNPGEIFIFTDTNYVGYDWTTQTTVPLQVPAAVVPIKSQLKFGISGFQAGNNTDVVVNLHGINRHHSLLPETLKAFRAPILMWQDQNNSVVKYYDDPTLPDATYREDCVVGYGPGCTNTRLESNKSPELFFKASPGSFLYGVIYQPRGSWTTMGGGSGYSGPLQIVSGGFKVQGNAVLHLAGVHDPMVRPVVALIE